MAARKLAPLTSGTHQALGAALRRRAERDEMGAQVFVRSPAARNRRRGASPGSVVVTTWGRHPTSEVAAWLHANVAAGVLCELDVGVYGGGRVFGTFEDYLACALGGRDCLTRLPGERLDDDWAYWGATLDPVLARAVEVAAPGLAASGCSSEEALAVAAALTAAPASR